MTTRPPLPDPLRGTRWGEDPGRVGAAITALTLGPEPEATAGRLARILQMAPGLAEASLSDPVLAGRLVAVSGSGRALGAICVALGDDAAAALTMGGVPTPRIEIAEGDPAAALRREVGGGLLAIAGLDLTRTITMPAVGAALSDLADAAAAAALDLVLISHPGVRMAVIALGKWGGRELNYASDIDLVFVHEGDPDAAMRAAAAFIEMLSERTATGIAFRVDADLRPEGAAGPLSRSVDSYRAYWSQWAHTWEFQALLKARPAAGDRELAAAFMAAAEPFVHPDTLGGEAVREIRAMKARTEARVTEPDELKRGVGGIRDIEFAVQLLQLVHGRADPALRTPNTLEALDQLGAGGYLRPEDAEELGAAYRWLRDVEHRIQLQDLRQSHTVPADLPGRDRLAKVMGYRDDPSATALERFESDLARYRTAVRGIHERLFFRPLLEAYADSARDARADRQLAALGFTDSAATRAAVAELTAGLSRRSSLMQQLLPLVMEWLSTSPDPDLGLAQLRLLVGDEADSALVGTLRDHPAAAERLCRLLGTARTVGRLVDRIPAALPLLADDAALAAPTDAMALVAAVQARLAVRADHASRVVALHRFWAEHLLATITADVAGLIDVVAVGHRLTATADALVAGLLAAAVDAARAEGRNPPPLAVIALGKWGGGELTYPSDLDGLIVFSPSGRSGEESDAARVAELLVSSLAASSLGLPPPPLDLDLRPEGRKGVIVRSLDAYGAYWTRWALTWEHQSLLRVRAAAGDTAVGAEFVAAAGLHAHPAWLDPSRIREVRAMKARIEQERIPVGEDPDFHVKLGRGALADVEWVVQLLQMEHAHGVAELRGPSTLGALAALRHTGVLTGEDADSLDRAYRFCAAVRNRLFLRAGRIRDSLPTDPIEATAVARSLGYDLAPRTSLREEYQRVTRRARRVVERVFYGG
ncbi:MAG: bifunctional [glutamine synthetase] adenylyltransferase/[glutamine synthetase]-adenylyl-L-tyrosine phosphorylase [Acidimicrobiia bacterium]|nr:bifunctional [glutamine synthetase] adenylyltransferase/[glutamine synthetase]-adenylyl-L-tyrosine phosphorylase [Acidimicrobiia bacterium]